MSARRRSTRIRFSLGMALALPLALTLGFTVPALAHERVSLNEGSRFTLGDPADAKGLDYDVRPMGCKARK